MPQKEFEMKTRIIISYFWQNESGDTPELPLLSILDDEAISHIKEAWLDCFTSGELHYDEDNETGNGYWHGWWDMTMERDK